MLNEITLVVRCRMLLVIFELKQSAYFFSSGKEKEFASGIYLGCGLLFFFNATKRNSLFDHLLKHLLFL